MDQAEQAVPSIEDRIAAALNPPEEKKEEPKEEAHEEVGEQNAKEEGGDAEQEQEEQQAEDLLTPEQLAHYKVKVKHGDEEKEVSLEEARLGYMRQEDYSRKTQEIAKQREETSKKVKEESEKARNEYQQNVKMFYQAVATLADSELVNTDWNKLANEDPAEFVKKTHRKTQFENVLKAAQQEIQKQEEAQKAEKAERDAQAMQQAIERLKTSLPGWGEELASKITKSAKNYGFTDDELRGISDARYVEVLHDAMQYRLLKDQKPLVDKKVADVPKVLKPGTQQSKVSVNTEREKELRGTFKKSGSTDDLAMLLLNRNKNRR